MADSAGQASPHTAGEHLVLFDGVCGLCSRVVQFLLARDRRGVFAFAPLQSETGRVWATRFGRNPDVLGSFYVIARYEQSAPRLLERSRAALFVASALGWPWKIAGLFGALPHRWLDAAYDAVANNRYRMFGVREQCLRPTPEQRGRFVG